ncbi:filamentous hemagglutinin N-terminal domain-containing protein [Aulosira sp. FACHB-615]|uniref:two-partner secretion domain-containing protein n=1 Tax=Aulosira sp. FACHB-615 TaxID=2692777 RepID=UPI0016829CA4|nr:filamentous hemagglutinin N-terminal domain-containing protein [Aulosira sp. FACHB-615]MBD2491231.1 filamentous hemagglutinin N-terminal domain-containing protein [Aulosira sp. FACHB-615]
MLKLIKQIIQVGLLSWLVGIVTETSVLAQSSNLVTDDTLKTETSIVQQNFFGLPLELIQGGAIRGSNLFHSFREFNISEGRSAYFISPSVDIQNIFARVTGKNRSEILGTLGILQSDFKPSSANLFLINPNGIIFGQNSRLDTRGSFVATTADAVQFNNKGFFSASNPQVPQLLTINPSSFLFNQIKPATIINKSRAANIFSPQSNDGIFTLPGKSLILLGGNVILDGGILTTFDGKIDIGGLAENGSVSFSIYEENFHLSFPTTIAKSDIYLMQEARILNASIRAKGEVNLFGNNINISGESSISSFNFGDQNSRGIKIQASQLNIEQTSNISTLTSYFGKGGDILINTRNLNISDFSLIRTVTNRFGNSGDILINTENLNMDLGYILTTTSGGQGNAGNILIQATNSVNLNNTSGLLTGSSGLGNSTNQGSGGNLFVDTKILNLENASGIGTISFLGQGIPGNLTLRSSDSINLSNSRITSASFSSASGGNITIETGTLNILNGTQINNSSFSPLSIIDLLQNNPSVTDPVLLEFLNVNTQPIIDFINSSVNTDNIAQSNSGNINIRATKSIVISGVSPFRQTRNLISTQTVGAGKAGTLTLETRELIASDGSALSTETTGTGDGGNLIIKADTVNLTNNVEIRAFSEGIGKAGNINLTVNKNFNATDSFVFTSSEISSGGAINISAENIRLFGNSDIRTNVFSGTGGGGNIILTANSIIALDDSDILSFSRDGRGGDIRFNTRAFLSSPLYRANRFTNDATTLNIIDANQQVDVNASGAISGTITGIPDISFLQNSLTQLPKNVVDPNSLIANSCIARRNNQQSSTFFVIGSGGLPERPGDAPLSSYATGTIQPIPSENNSPATNSPRPRWKIGDPIVEPQGVYQLSNGKRILSRECAE